MPVKAEPSRIPAATETAVIVAVPDAEPIVGRHRRRLDPAAAWGVPAHVTILYPFVDPVDVTDDVIELLVDAIGDTHTFSCAFKRTRWFDTDVLWLEPDPDAPFRALTKAVVEAFPSHLPYGGLYGPDWTPHLTIAESRRANGIDELLAAEAQVEQHLPFETRVVDVWLMAGTAAPDSWRVVARVPLRA